MPKHIALGANESLWRWHACKAPTHVPSSGDGLVDDDFQGFVIRSEFQRGRMPMDQFVRGETRYLEAVGFSAPELTRSSDLGYFRYSDTEAPRKVSMLPQEMAIRVARLSLISPRDGDRVATWEFSDGGIPARLMVLCKDGVLMAEDRGRGDGRPELMCPGEECVAANELRTTSKTREETLARGGHAIQSPFPPETRPSLPVPTVPRVDLEVRDFLLGH